MASVVKYLAWNVFLIGTLLIGYVFGATNTAGLIIGIVYSVILPLYFVCFLFSAADKENKLAAAFKSWKWWKYITETAFIAITAYMGYKKLAVCMFVELSMITYLWISTKTKTKELEKEANNQEVK